MRRPIITRLSVVATFIFTFLLFSCDGGGDGGSSPESYGKPRAEDVANSAINQLGGQAQASLAILLATDKGYTLQQVADGINTGALTQSGDITGVAPAGSPQSVFTRGMAVFARASAVTGDDINDVLEQRDREMAVLILMAIQRGYSVAQITEAIIFDTLAYCIPGYACITDGKGGFVEPALPGQDVFDDSDSGGSGGDTGEDATSGGGGDTNSAVTSWIVKTWNSSGSAQFSNSYSSSSGTFTFNADGTYVHDYDWTNTSGGTTGGGHATVTDSWSLDGGVLTTQRGDGSCSGDAPDNASRIVLSCTNGWTITLTG